MDGHQTVLPLISFDPLSVALAFSLFTVSASFLAHRLGSWLAVVSAIAFGYCTLAHVIHFSLQFVRNSSLIPFGNILFHMWLLWPMALLTAAIASFVLLARSTGSRALTIRSSGPL
jgi:xanthine/uracil permease